MFYLGLNYKTIELNWRSSIYLIVGLVENVQVVLSVSFFLQINATTLFYQYYETRERAPSNEYHP